MMKTPLELTLGVNRTPYVQALYDSSVQAKGIRLAITNDFSAGLDNTGERHRQILDGRLIGGECSTSSFLLACTRGEPLVALPVFLARSFPHRQIWCNTTAGIQSPSDLAGKRVTVHRWNSTSPTWTKGLLQNEYGVDLHSVHWYTAEPDPEGEGAPPEFEIQRIPEPSTRERALEMLANGELDAGLDPYVQLGPTVRHVLDDWQAEARAFFQQRGIFPMSHTLVVRRELLDEHPWVAESLLEAFRAARQEAPRYQTEADQAQEHWFWDVLDQDPRLYQLGPIERQTLEELVRYQFQQGLRTEEIDPLAQFAFAGD